MKWDIWNGSYFELWINTFSPIGLISSMDSRALCLVIAKVRVRFLVNNELPLFIRTNQERLSEQLLHYRFILPRRSCSLWYLFSLTLTFKTSCSVVKEYFQGVNRAFFGSLPTQIPFKVNIIAKSTLQTIHLSAHNLIFLLKTTHSCESI